MNKVYCSIITKDMREQAARLNLNVSYLNNLISTIKSIQNNGSLVVTDEMIKEYLENNKDKIEDIQLAIPYYKEIKNKELRRGGFTNGIIEINKFTDEYTPQDWLNESAKLYEVTPYMLQNLDLFDSTKAIYTYQLYLWKLLVERGLNLYTMDHKEKAKYINSALKQLKKAKEKYKDSYDVPTSKAFYNDGEKNHQVNYKIVPVLGNNNLYEIKNGVLLIRNNIKLTDIDNYFKQNKEQFDKLLSKGYTKTDIYKGLDSQDKIRDFVIALAYNNFNLDKLLKQGNQTNTEDNETSPTSLEELEKKIQSDSQKMRLSDDEKYYVDEKGNKYARVTSVITTKADRFDPNSPWALPSSNVGTGVDVFVRDFFDDKIKNTDNLDKKYPNANQEALKQLYDDLQKIKDKINGKYKIVSKDVTLKGTIPVTDKNGKTYNLNVAGTVDLLIYDNDGNFYIYDMKTHHSNNELYKDTVKLEKYRKQVSLYKALFEQQYGKNVKGLALIPIHVNYPAPKGANNGTAEYSLGNKPNQLLIDGKKFKDANPTLEKTIPVTPQKVEIHYENLTDETKELIGKNDTNSIEKNKTTQTQQTTKQSFNPIEKALNAVNITSDKPLVLVGNERTSPKIEFIQSENNGYASRTIENTNWSDITLAIAEDFNTQGERLTKAAAKNKYVSEFLHKSATDIANSIYEQLVKKGKTKDIKLNIAGNGIYSIKDMNQKTLDNHLYHIIKGLLNRGITISEIRTGGQTGIDEAGAKAGAKLGIKTSVLAPKGWLFRNKEGSDISNKKMFIGRFDYDNQQTEKKETTPTVTRTIIDLAHLDNDNTPMIGEQEHLILDTESNYVKVARAFTPMEYNDRLETISHTFSNLLTNTLYDLIDEYEQKVEEAETEEDRLFYEQELAELKGEGGKRKVLGIINFDKFIKRVKSIAFDAIGENSDEFLDKKFAKYGGAAVVRQKLKNINDYWDILFEDACNKIEQNEGIRIRIENNNEERNEVYTENTEREEINEEEQIGDSEEGKEATGNDGYNYQVRMTNPHETLTHVVKEILRDIIKCHLDDNGEMQFESDDLGNTRYMREDVVYATILSELSKDMISPEDFVEIDPTTDDEVDRYVSFPALEKLIPKYPWIQQVIDKLYGTDIANSHRTISLFYSAFRQDFIHYYTQTETQDKIKTITLNTQLSSESTFKDVIRNYENRNILIGKSIYNEDGSINNENIKELKKEYNKVFDKFLRIQEDNEGITNDPDNYINDILNKVNFFSVITKVARAVGFNIDKQLVKGLFNKNIEAIFNKKDNDFEKFTDALRYIIVNAKKLKDNEHLILNNERIKNSFENISEAIGTVTEEDVNMSSWNIEGKRVPSYSAPNYFNTTMRYLQSDSKRQDYINKQFKIYNWFYNKEKGEWNNEILRLLESDDKIGEKVRKMFTVKEIKILREGKETIKYEDWKPNQIKKAAIVEYFAHPFDWDEDAVNFGYFNLPILSDSPVELFVRLPKFRSSKNKGAYKEQLLPLYRRLIKQEIDRINLVRQRREKGCVEIQNFDKKGLTFCFMPELNTLKMSRNADTGKWYEDENGGTLFSELYNSIDSSEKDVLIDDAIEIINDNNFDDFMHNCDAAILTTISKSVGYSVNDKQAKEMLEEYFWNQVYWSSQLIQLFTTDLAFYKNGVDFQKRFKEIYAAGTKLNTLSRYGRKFEKTIYIKDNIITSSDYLHMKEVIDEKVKDNWLSKEDAVAILDKFKNINQTDAQAYRHLGSYRAVLDMMGLWTSDMEDIFEKLESGNELSETDKMKAFTIIWQQIKPFVYTQVDTNDGLGGRMKVPHQNKNSEFLLLSLYDILASPMQRSARFKGMNKFMKDNDIDVIQFESAVKCGGQGYIDISVSEKKVNKAIANQEITIGNKGNKITTPLQGVKSWNDIKKAFDKALDSGNISQEDYNTIMKYFEPSEQEVYDMLEKYSKNKISDTDEINDDGFNTSVVHYLPYENYCIAQATPEHLYDAQSIFGSQHRNIVTSNMPDDMVITVNGLTLRAKNENGENEIKKFHDALIVENLLDSFNKLRNTFNSIQDLQKELFQMIKGNPKYGRDMLNALQIVKREINGEMVDTFNIPLHNPSTTNQLQELINSLFKNRITRQKIKGGKATLASNFGFTRELNILKGEDGGILGAECYLPFYTQKYLTTALVDKKLSNGQTVKVVDINKVDKDLLKILGFRIPTESHYSMLPMIIKGFLPQQNGSTIMLPADITQIAGEDFDIDGRFLFIPESRLQVYDYKRAYRDYKEGRNESNKLGNLNTNGVLQDLLDQFNEELSDEEKTFKEWFEEHKEEYRLEHPKLKKIRYNTKKSISENSREARNNMIIDIEYAILSHPSTAKKIFNPGNFDKVKAESRRLQILNDDRLLKKYMEIRGIDRKDISKTLLSESLDSLDNFLKQYQRERNSLLLDTFVYNHVQNMTGKKLIGIYANGNTAFTKFQQTNLGIKPDFQFKINGKVFKSLHNIKTNINGIDVYITENIAQMLASSVDNVKDPVLAAILQNTDTAAIAVAMLMTGMSIQEMSLMFSQPIVREWILNGGGISSRYVLPKLLADIADEFGFKIRDFKNDVTSEDLVNNILNYKLFNFDEITDDTIDFFNTDGVNARATLLNNLKSAALFCNIMNIAYDLNNLIQISRADSPNGAMKRNIASVTNQLHRVDAFHIRSYVNKAFTLEGTEDCVKNNVVSENASIDTMRDKILEQKMPMLQAFHTLGIDLGLKLESKFFVQENPFVRDTVNKLYENTPYNSLTDETLLSFYDDMPRFFLSNTKMFGDDGTRTFEEKRDYYLYKYPMKFLQTILNPKNKELFDYGIMKQINVRDGKIVMENAQSITITLRELYMRDFENMLYSNNPVARQMVLDLFAYNFYLNGFNWGRRSFNKFFSTVFLNSFPEIINTLDNMQNNMSIKTMENYLYQFYMNHFKEKNLLPHAVITKQQMQQDGSIFIRNKFCKNKNTIKKNSYHELIVGEQRDMYTGELEDIKLYMLDPEFEITGFKKYIPVETFSDNQDTLYNSTKDFSELINSQTDPELIKQAMQLDYNNIDIIDSSKPTTSDNNKDNITNDSSSDEITDDTLKPSVSNEELDTKPLFSLGKKPLSTNSDEITTDIDESILNDSYFTRISQGYKEPLIDMNTGEEIIEENDELDFKAMNNIKNEELVRNIAEGKRKTGEKKC